jgi:integrase/recombinase XerC
MLNNYIAWCKLRGLRDRYIQEISRTLTRLQTDIGPLHLAEERAVRDWWERLDIQPQSRGAYAAHVAGFYRWCIREHIRDADPTERLVRPRQVHYLPRPIERSHLDRALEHAPDPVLVWLVLAAYMGLRAHEIATLHGEDLRGERLFVRDGKGGRQRIVPLHPRAAELLAFAPRHGPVFRNRQGEPIRANTLQKRANRYLHDIGIPDTLHSLRHRFGTDFYQLSKDLRLTQTVMGHSSPTTTALYVECDADAASHVVRQLGRSYYSGSRKSR